MPVVTMTEAALALGYRSRSTLSRLRRDGKLSRFDRQGGRIELTGLAEHLRSIMRIDALPLATAPDPPQLQPPGPREKPGLTTAQRQALADARLQAQARLLAIRAEASAIALAKEKGELVPAAEVTAMIGQEVGRLRDALVVLPVQLGPTLEGLTAGAIQIELDRGIRECLLRLSGGLAAKVPGELVVPAEAVTLPPGWEAWWPGRKVSASEQGTIIDVENGENLAQPWPAPQPPPTLGRAFTWGREGVSDWGPISPMQRHLMQRAWEQHRAPRK
jgi:hypothetical protein